MLVYKGPSLIRFALLEMLFDILRKINPDKNILHQTIVETHWTFSVKFTNFKHFIVVKQLCFVAVLFTSRHHINAGKV